MRLDKHERNKDMLFSWRGEMSWRHDVTRHAKYLELYARRNTSGLDSRTKCMLDLWET